MKLRREEMKPGFMYKLSTSSYSVAIFVGETVEYPFCSVSNTGKVRRWTNADYEAEVIGFLPMEFFV